MYITITQFLKETIPLFELFDVGEEFELNDGCILAINEPRPNDIKKLQEYIVNRTYLGFDTKEDAKWLMWIGSVDPMQLFTSDLQVRKDLHPVVIQSLTGVKKDELISRMGPWRCEDAAYIGNLCLLQHLHKEGYLWNEMSCYNAALNGHLEVLKYLRKKCPWNKDVCFVAAKFGRLDVLKYIRKKGCSWDEHLFCGG